MPQFSYGVKSIKAGGIDPVTGLPVDLVDMGDVYKNTATMYQEEETYTEHFSEFKTDPIVTVSEPDGEIFEFSLMDTSADNLVAWCGGSVVAVVDEPDQWKKPKGMRVIEKSIEIRLEDDTLLTINRGKCIARRVTNPTRAGTFLIEVAVQVLEPKVEGVNAVVIDKYVAPSIVLESLTVDAGAINLAWNVAGKTKPTEVQVLRSEVAGGPYDTLDTLEFSEETFADDTWVYGVTYYYVIRAVYADGNIDTEEVSITAEGLGFMELGDDFEIG